MQKVHIVGLGVGAEGGDQHDIIGIERNDADYQHEGIQKPPHHGLMHRAVAQLQPAQQHGETAGKRQPDKSRAVKTQALKNGSGIFSGRSVKEKSIQLCEEAFLPLAEKIGTVERNLPGKDHRVHHHKNRHQQHRDQREHHGSPPQDRRAPVQHPGQILHGAQTAAERAGHRQNQAAQHDAEHHRGSKPCPQERPAAPTEGLADAEGDQRTRFAFGVGALGDALLHAHLKAPFAKGALR